MTDTIDLGATVDQTGVTSRPDVNTGNLGVFGTVGVNTDAIGVVGATGTMRFDLAGLNTCTLTSATPCTLSFTAPARSNSKVYLKITQPAAGAATTVVFPGSVIGTPPQPTATLNAVTLYEFYYDGASYYFIHSSASSSGSGAGYLATSTTSLVTAGSGSKAFVTQAGLAYTVGARIRATSAGTSEWMEGVVTAYATTTLTVTMDSNSGTGTHADWNINIAGQPASNKKFPFTFSDATQSTKYDSTTKLILGSKKFDPNDATWGLTSSSTIVLHVLLAVTNSGNTAQADIYQQTGTGSPTVVASTATTNSTTAAELTIDVSTAFRPGANAGIFNVRCWLGTFNGNDQATCYGAWLEITP